MRGLAIAAWFNAVLWWWQLHQAMRKYGTAPIRGRYAAQHDQPAAKPLRCATASGLAASDGGRPGTALSESLFLPSLPSASSLPSRPPVASAPLSGPTDLLAPPNWSALSSVPASPMPSFTPELDRDGRLRQGLLRQDVHGEDSCQLVCHISGLRQRTAIRALGDTDARRSTQRGTRS